MNAHRLRAGAVCIAGVFSGLGVAWAGSAGRAAAAPKTQPAPGPSTDRTLQLPQTPSHSSEPPLPAHFNTPLARRFDNTPAENPVTDDGATLGRVLFYDTRLSAGNTVA